MKPTYIPYTLHKYLSEAGASSLPGWTQEVTVELPADIDDPDQKPNKPRADQVVALHRAIKTAVFGLYNEPGTGKTVVAQALNCYWAAKKEQSVVVMPPILLHQFWESLYDTFKGLESHVSAHIFCQGPADRARLKEAWGDDNQPDILLVSYEMYLREYDYLSRRNVKIFDEAQNLKNEASKTFRSLEGWIEANKREVCCLIMTGTPAHTDLRDLYALTRLTNPNAYPNRKYFERRHCIYENINISDAQRKLNNTKSRSMRVLVGFKNVENLSREAYVNAMRVTKDKVCTLPKPVVSILPVKLSDSHHKLYKKLSKERILEIGDVTLSAIQEQLLRQKLLQLVTCPELFIPEDAKVENNVIHAVNNIIDGMYINETKIILFVNFRQSVEFVAELFKRFNPAKLNGAVTNKEAQKQKFLTDPTCRMLVANVESAGVGLNLQGVCHTAIFMEPTGVPGDFKQAVERLWRSGQMHLVNIYIIKALATIAPRAIKNMLNREESIRKVNRDRFSLLDEVMREAA